MMTSPTSIIYAPDGLRYGGGLSKQLIGTIFNKRLSDGYNLSDRIWNVAQHGQQAIIQKVWQEIGKGTSAVDISKMVEMGLLKRGPAWTTGIKPSVTGRGTIAYNALRLARTEINQGYHQAQKLMSLGDPLVMGQKWNLSASHPTDWPPSAEYEGYPEICDYRAQADHSGLGPGIYPKGKAPSDHPNGLCYLTDEFHPVEQMSDLLGMALYEEGGLTEIAEATPWPWDDLDSFKGDVEDLHLELKNNYQKYGYKYKPIAEKLYENEAFRELVERKMMYPDMWQTSDENSKRTYMDSYVQGMLQKWAGTSGDGDPMAISMQLAAKEEFGLETASVWWQDRFVQRANEEFGDYQEGIRAFLRAQYEITQEYFKEKGQTHVFVMRGSAWWNGELPDEMKALPWGQELYKSSIELQPMSSFSANPIIAQDFANKKEYRMMTGFLVPVEDVVGVSLTGFGTDYESEVVVLGKNNWKDVYHVGHVSSGWGDSMDGENFMEKIFEAETEGR